MLYFPRPLSPETITKPAGNGISSVNPEIYADHDLWMNLFDCLKKHDSSPSNSRCTSSEDDDRKYERAYVRKNPIAMAEKQYHGDGYFRG